MTRHVWVTPPALTHPLLPPESSSRRLRRRRGDRVGHRRGGWVRWTWTAPLLVAVLGGCEPSPEFDHAGLPVFGNAGRRQISRSDALGIPFHSAVVGDYLVVLDRAGGPTVHILDRFNGALLQSYGRQGAGPGEFEGPWSVDPDPSAEGFWVYDVAHTRLTHVDLGRLLLDPDSVVPEIVDVRASAPVSGPVWTSAGVWVASADFDDARMSQLDRDGTEVGRVGPAPPGDPRVPAVVRKGIHEGHVVAGPHRDRVVLSSWYEPRIDVFDPQGALLAVMDVPFPWQIGPEDLVSQEFFVLRRSTRLGYMKASASDRRVFALFSGRSMLSHPDEEGLGSFVHVFDWSGRFVGYIPLSVDAVDISVSPDGTRLYAVEWEPVPTVSVYELSEPER